MFNQINWGNLTPEIFLRDYWQKKPLIIKNAISDFEDPISANELAGLAMEAHIESRIIAQDRHKKWQVTHGPFEDFSTFGERNWTLLVQAVNHWSRETNQLIELIDFIPQWRIDDVMVSFSTPHGGVGPHLDQYDVFILQGEGKRHWRVGAPDANLEELLPHPDLKQVSNFEPIIDEITEPGDLLYIPPNHPHDGSSIENSMNYSIGFQAPNGQEMLSAFADSIIDQNKATGRFSDLGRELTTTPENLTAQDITAVKQFMLEQLSNEENLDDFISRYLTKSHHGLELLLPVNPITLEQLTDIIAEDENLIVPVSGIKALINEQSNTLVINGDNFELTNGNALFAKQLAQKSVFEGIELQSILQHNDEKTLLINVLNKGYWYVQ